MANTWDEMTLEPLTQFYFYCNVEGERSECAFSSLVFTDCNNFSAQEIVHIKRLQCGTCRPLQDDRAGQVQGAQDHLPCDQHQVSVGDVKFFW